MKQRLAFAFIMGIISTCIMSFTLIAINLGFSDKFLNVWLRSWAMAYLVVIPVILLFGPLVQQLVDYLFYKKQSK